MGFPAQQARPFTRQQVEALNPNQFGVYGIYNARGCLYVGKGDVRTRLLAHLGGDIPCITMNGPSYWLDEVTSNMDLRERELILELRPSCNQRIG